jgi:Zn finger protein HypA/HybF involved in hydrogenase expression
MATTIVPTEALRMALERASTRAHAQDEARALSDLRACLECRPRNHCRDADGHVTYCHVCTVPECPHDRHGGI